MKKKTMVCIICPDGCRLEVDENLHVEGNRCSRGVAYAKKEATNPERHLTTTVAIESVLFPRLSVKSSGALPKAKLRQAVAVLDGVVVKPPIKVGDVIVRDILGTGVDFVATRSLDR